MTSSVSKSEFAGSADKGKPLMVVSATISSAPTMVYFGQEVGEAGNECWIWNTFKNILIMLVCQITSVG
jgi:hypothetical protein